MISAVLCSGLHFVAATGNLPCVQLFIKAGADLDLGDKDGEPSGSLRPSNWHAETRCHCNRRGRLLAKARGFHEAMRGCRLHLSAHGGGLHSMAVKAAAAGGKTRAMVHLVME